MISSPRSLFGGMDAGEFEITDINREKEYITIKPEGSIELPFEFSLIKKAVDLVLSEGVVSLESEEDTNGPVVLEKNSKSGSLKKISRCSIQNSSLISQTSSSFRESQHTAG